MREAASGRVEFGIDVDAAVRHWGGYSDFPDGFGQVHRVLAVLEPHLGPVEGCYSLGSGGYAAVRLAGMPAFNAITAHFGYVFITAAAAQAIADSGVDLVERLRASGLDPHDGVEDGKTVWNAQGLRDRQQSERDSPLRRLCPDCFLQWPGDTCPDCGVALTGPGKS